MTEPLTYEALIYRLRRLAADLLARRPVGEVQHV